MRTLDDRLLTLLAEGWTITLGFDDGAIGIPVARATKGLRSAAVGGGGVMQTVETLLDTIDIGDAQDGVKTALTISQLEQMLATLKGTLLPLAGKAFQAAMSKHGVSTRGLNVLDTLRVDSLADLSKLTKYDLLNARACGQKTVREIERAAAKLGATISNRWPDDGRFEPAVAPPAPTGGDRRE